MTPPLKTTPANDMSPTPGAGRFLSRLCTEALLAPMEVVGAWMPLLTMPFAGGQSNGPGRLEPLGAGLARLQVDGVMMRKPDAWERVMLGATDTEELRAAAEEAMRPDIKGLLVDVDSPGGFLIGGPEFADALSAVADAKPVVAWTGGMMASLAYWAGSQAGMVMASPSAAVGSIGAYITVRDFSRLLESFGIRTEVFTNREGTYKGIGILGRPLTDAHRDLLQADVDSAFSDFRAAVTRRRTTVNPDAMRGQTMPGTKAALAGLINQTGSFRDAVGTLKMWADRTATVGVR